MTDEETVFYALVAIGIVSLAWGVYETATTGEVDVLVITGLGCATVALAVRHESETNSEGADDGAATEGSP